MRSGVPLRMRVVIIEGNNLVQFVQNVSLDGGICVLVDSNSSRSVWDENRTKTFIQSDAVQRSLNMGSDINQSRSRAGPNLEFVHV